MLRYTLFQLFRNLTRMNAVTKQPGLGGKQRF